MEGCDLEKVEEKRVCYTLTLSGGTSSAIFCLMKSITSTLDMTSHTPTIDNTSS